MDRRGTGRGDEGVRGLTPPTHTIEPVTDEVAVVAWPLLVRERVSVFVEHHPRRTAMVLVAVLSGLFAVGFTITILSVSLDRIADDFGTDTSVATWVLTGPILTAGVVGPLAGKLADSLGRRRVFVWSLASTAVTAALIAVAPTIEALIGLRILAALLGAGVGPAAMALVMEEFPPSERVRAMGWWSLVGAGAPVLGVVAGGPIVEHVGWRVIFAVQAPVTVVAVVLAAVVLPHGVSRKRGRLDVGGALLLGAGVAALLVYLNRGQAWGWSSPQSLVVLLSAPLFLAAFVIHERRQAEPLIRLDYFRRRNVVAPVTSQAFANFAYMGSFVLTPQFLHRAFGYGETRIGLLSIARPIVFAVAAPLAARVTMRVRERNAAVIGSLLLVGSMIALSTLDPGASDLAVMASLALAGAGMGVAGPALSASVANAVDDRDLGVVNATQQAMVQVGIVAGIQVLATVQAAQEPNGLVASFSRAYWVAAAAALVAMVVAHLVRPTPRVET